MNTYNNSLAFDRCANLLVSLIEKYGNEINLSSDDATAIAKQHCEKTDAA